MDDFERMEQEKFKKLDAFLNFRSENNEDDMTEIARLNKNIFDSHIKVGFNPVVALELTKAMVQEIIRSSLRKGE